MAIDASDFVKPRTGLGSRNVTEAFYRAAAMAGYAPSIQNRQPWRWCLGSDVLDLFLVRERLDGVNDRCDRLALMSCGAALHHARIGLAAYGWSAGVELMPGPDADHLARIRIDGIIPTDLAIVRLAQLMRWRRTDRRPVSGEPPAPEDLVAVDEAVSARSVALHHLGVEQMPGLAGGPDAVQWNQEIADCCFPSFGVLHGAGDVFADWIRAGEALSAAWLVATGHGISVLPLSAPAVNARVSARVREILVDHDRPYLAVRLVHHAGDGARRATPRLPERQLIER